MYITSTGKGTGGMSSKGSLLEGCVTTVRLPVNTVCMEVWIKQDTYPQCPQCIQNTGTNCLLHEKLTRVCLAQLLQCSHWGQ